MLEKLSWAEREGVTPPDFLVKRVARAAKAVRTGGCPHCAAAGGERRGAGTSVAACRQAADPNCGGQRPGGTPLREDLSHRSVVLLRAAQCRGLDWCWSVLMTGWLSTVPVILPDQTPPIEWLSARDDRADCPTRDADPPVP